MDWDISDLAIDDRKLGPTPKRIDLFFFQDFRKAWVETCLFHSCPGVAAGLFLPCLPILTPWFVRSGSLLWTPNTHLCIKLPYTQPTLKPELLPACMCQLYFIYFIKKRGKKKEKKKKKKNAMCVKLEATAMESQEQQPRSSR